MSALSPALPRVRALIVSPRVVLGGIVAVSTIAEFFVARARPTPSTFPDEYLYSALARSIAHGHLRVHGVPAHFPALVVPLLTSPAWLVHGVGTAYRLVQFENALVMSLAAIPAYAFARRFCASYGLALGVAVLAVAAPPLFYVPLLQSEAFAYPLALAFALAAVATIEGPTRRRGGLLIALSVLITVTRVQLAALPLAVAVTVVVVALRERRLRAALREHALFLGFVAVTAAGGLTVELTRGLGFYRHLAPKAGSAAGAASIAGVDLYAVALTAGVAIVPAAVIGLALALGRPRSRGELAFGVLAVVTAGALVIQAALWGDVSLVQERYLVYLLPLLGVSFALRTTRAQRRRIAELGVAAALAATASIVQLPGHAIDSLHKEAPVMSAFVRLMESTGNAGSAATVFAGLVTVLALLGVAASVRRLGLAVLVVSTAAAAALLAGAISVARSANAFSRAHYLPTDAAWVDRAARGPATMLVVPGAPQGTSLATLFWNPSLSRVVMLPGSLAPDRLADPVVRVAADGALTVAGAPMGGPLLVDGDSTTVAFRAASVVASWQGEQLWRPRSAAHLSAEVIGRLPNGQLLPLGSVRVWAPSKRLAGWIELRLTTPHTLAASHVQLGGQTYVAPRGTTRRIRIAVCGAGPWRSGFHAGPAVDVHGTVASPMVSVPRYVPDLSACP